AIGFLADITARKQVEASLRESEQAIRTLQEAISHPTLTFDQRIQAILELGCRRFNLPIGIVTRVEGDELVIAHVSSPTGASSNSSTTVRVGQTYCQSTLATEGPICFGQAISSEWREHPGCVTLGVECYIGTKLIGLNSVHGTICFVATTPQPIRLT